MKPSPYANPPSAGESDIENGSIHNYKFRMQKYFYNNN